jgi:hypothetical protein
LACFISSGLGVAAASILAFYLFDLSSEAYSATAYGILIGLVACELFASVAIAVRRTIGGGGLFVILASPLAFYEYSTAIAGGGVTHFFSLAALGAGVLSLLLGFLSLWLSESDSSQSNPPESTSAGSP